MYKVYRIAFPNGDEYIGSTSDKYPSVRWGGHRHKAKKGIHYNKKLSNNILSYSKEETIYEVLNEVTTKDEARLLEQKYINESKQCINQNRAFATKEDKLNDERIRQNKRYHNLNEEEKRKYIQKTVENDRKRRAKRASL